MVFFCDFEADFELFFLAEHVVAVGEDVFVAILGEALDPASKNAIENFRFEIPRHKALDSLWKIHETFILEGCLYNQYQLAYNSRRIEIISYILGFTYSLWVGLPQKSFEAVRHARQLLN